MRTIDFFLESVYNLSMALLLPPGLYHSTSTVITDGVLRPQPTIAGSSFGNPIVCNVVMANRVLENFPPTAIMSYLYALKDARDCEPGSMLGLWDTGTTLESGIFYTVIYDRDAFLKRFKGGSIIPVPQDMFKPIRYRGYDSNEYTCETDVPIDPSKIIPITSLDQVMQTGAQILFLAPDQNPREYIKNRYSVGLYNVGQMTEDIKAGRLIHENAVRNIKPMWFEPILTGGFCGCVAAMPYDTKPAAIKKAGRGKTIVTEAVRRRKGRQKE